VPPLSRRLREMPSELETLVAHILRRMSDGHDEALTAQVVSAIERGVGRAYAWPGNVRELEQAVRRILLTGAYAGDSTMTEKSEGDLSDALNRGDLTVKELTSAYCRRLFKRYGRYEEVAKRTGLDWRTVKKHIDA